MTQQNLRQTVAPPHSPIEIHVATNGHVGEGSALVGNACRQCSPAALIRDLEDGELIDTDQVAWWPCQHALPQAPN